MKTEIIRKNNTDVAVISSNELLVKDVQSALDLIMTVKYETGCTNIAINKPLKYFMYKSNKGNDIYFQPYRFPGCWQAFWEG